MAEYYFSKILLAKIFASGHSLEINENYRKYAALQLFMQLKRNKLKEPVKFCSIIYVVQKLQSQKIKNNGTIT